MEQEYNGISDEELLCAFRAGDEAAGSELVARCRPLVKRCTRPYYLVGGDSEDLIQEGMLGLVSSIQNYQPDGGASFKSYAELCVKRRIISAIKSASRFKHMPLNQRLSLEELYSENSADIPELDVARSPEELIIEREKKSELYRLCASVLTPLEKKVVAYYLEGLSYEEIAERCGKNAKSVDSALQRSRRKLSQAADI